MRPNLPVTTREYGFSTCAALMSTTAPHSHIGYANDAFASASEFTREEIAISFAHMFVKASAGICGCRAYGILQVLEAIDGLDEVAQKVSNTGGCVRLTPWVY
jgi:hypothetical protein